MQKKGGRKGLSKKEAGEHKNCGGWGEKKKSRKGRKKFSTVIPVWLRGGTRLSGRKKKEALGANAPWKEERERSRLLSGNSDDKVTFRVTGKGDQLQKKKKKKKKKNY